MTRVKRVSSAFDGVDDVEGRLPGDPVVGAGVVRRGLGAAHDEVQVREAAVGVEEQTSRV